MKLMKFTPVLLSSVLLAACSTATDVVNNTVNTVENAVTTVAEKTTETVSNVNDTLSSSISKLNTSTKFVVYRCNNTSVTAAYAFEGDDVKSVNLSTAETQINGLLVDTTSATPITFASKEYRWQVDPTFSRANFDKVTGVSLFKQGGTGEQIVAENCRIDTAFTKRLNRK